ncbi:MAG: hypothetical protein SCARUB_01663 [Candidatus Scalindua rubra]|uniref:DNA methylase adenine-specific domain-containing protein n=1 Tax=Candidatus Scalindua rubra TaxID=1872076 RepID=A0A1E3XC26_9BACT|nr:MAG: hypothetical protein SCARUB_01663 [Candidatus Scalindua rubra]
MNPNQIKRNSLNFFISDSWLDNNGNLQKYLLENYKIVAIIESHVESFFKKLNIKACIIMLEKCKDKNVLDNNIVRFVSFKKPLKCFTRLLTKMNLESLKSIILVYDEFCETDDLRIFPKSQRELWDEVRWKKYLI